MIDRAIGEVLAESVDEVLETMFFTCPLGPAESGEWSAGDFRAVVGFGGDLHGRLIVRLTADGARAVAAAFLGAEEADVRPEQMSAVVGEMANMLCGSLLSRLRSDACLELGSPEVGMTEEAAEGDPSMHGEAADCPAFELETGRLGIGLEIRELAESK